MVLYWAIDIDVKKVMENEQIKNFIGNHKELIPLEKIHSTLLFVGRKKKNCENSINLENPEDIYIKNNDREVIMTVKQFGYSPNAFALDVESIMFVDDKNNCPSNAIRQHVTMALSNGTKAVDSVKTLLGEGTIEMLETPLVLYGKIKGYNY